LSNSTTIKMWKGRLHQQEQRAHQLHSALLQQQSHYQKILKATRDQHQNAIENYENLMRTNQEILRGHVAKYGDHVERLTQSEFLVRQLLSENEALVTTIQTMQKSSSGSTNKFNLIKSLSSAVSSHSPTNH